jgi:hypothetical protein
VIERWIKHAWGERESGPSRVLAATDPEIFHVPSDLDDDVRSKRARDVQKMKRILETTGFHACCCWICITEERKKSRIR